ncbi:MAG: septum formation initiator family protein [Clostridia bacterium]|nr:septum formation initiator family protein [Clostridia bacterium]
MKKAYKNMFVRLSLFAVLIFFTFTFISFRLQNNDLKVRADALQEKIDTLSEHIDELESDLDAPFDDEYVEKVAHDKLGMRYPQEVIYYSGEGDN